MKRRNRRHDRASKSRRDLRLEPLESRQLLTTYMVTSDASTGLNTLAAAILLSDADVAQPNVINFDIEGTGPQTIALTTPLPAITQPVTIDGTSQTGFVANTATATDNSAPTIILDGTNAGVATPGLLFTSTAAGSEVEGLQIEKFDGDGIEIQANDVSVSGDFIGIGPDAPDSTGFGNGGDGVAIEGGASGDSIGGAALASRNVITNNKRAGLSIDHAMSILVQGNFLGVDSSGYTPGAKPTIGNLGGDISVVDSADNTIGGSTDGSGNLLDDPLNITEPGLLISGEASTGNLVQGNTIGLDTGEGGASSIYIGIFIQDAPGNIIGGLAAGESNLFTDCLSCGIMVNDATTTTILGDDFFLNTDAITVETGQITASGLKIQLDNYGGGIFLNNSQGSSISSSTLVGTSPFLEGADFGIEARQSPGLSLQNDSITGASGSGVSLVLGSNNATLSGLVLSGNAYDGIEANASTGLILSGSTIQGNAGVGISVLAGSDDASITGSTVGGVAEGQGNGSMLGGAGILVEDSAAPTINGTTVASDSGFGIWLQSAPLASLSDDEVSGESDSGANSGDGIRVEGSDNVSITGASIHGNAGIGVNVSGSGGLDLSGSTVQSNAGGGIAMTGSSPGGAPSTISGSTVGGPTASLGNGILGVLLSDSGAYVANDAIAGNAGPGLVADAGSDATAAAPGLDSATITGNAGDGIDVNASTGFSLIASIVQGNQGVGVSLANGSASASISGATIGGTATGQANAGIGLLLSGSDHVNVLVSSIMDDAGFGVEAVRSDFTTLGNVTVGGTTELGADLGDGVLAVLSRSLSLIGASITGNAGIGINIDRSASAGVQGATVAANAGGGVDLHESGSAAVSGSTIGGTTPATGNGTVGILVEGSTNASMTGDVVEANHGNGIRISFGSSSALVSNETVSDNTGSGIIVSSPTPSITGTQVDGNRQVGIELYYSVAGLIASSGVGNLAANQDKGIEVLNSDDVTIGGTSASAGNLVSNNLGTGIDIESSGGVSIAYDTVESDGDDPGYGDGIDAFGDVGISLDHDAVDKAGHVGINLYEANSGSSLTNSTITASGGVGVLVDTSAGLTLTGDTIRENDGSGIEANNSDGLTIGGSKFDDNPGFGLQIYASDHVTIGGSAGPNEASGTSNPDPFEGGGRQGEGLELVDLTDPTVTDFTSTANQGPGILVLGVTGGTISGATLGGTTASLGNGEQGLLVQNSSQFNVVGTETPVVVENNVGIGIEVNGTLDPTLRGLTVEANQGDGVNLAGSVGLLLTGSTIEYQGGSGLVVASGSDNATLVGNTISGNTAQDIVVSDSKNFVNND